MSYKFTNGGWPQRLSDGAFVNPDTNEEYLAWLAAGNIPIPADVPHPNIAIDAQIAALEGKTERGVREAMLYTLVAIAAAQGITEPQLYAANYGYRKARDIDNAIAALRAQRV